MASKAISLNRVFGEQRDIDDNFQSTHSPPTHIFRHSKQAKNCEGRLKVAPVKNLKALSTKTCLWRISKRLRIR